MGFMDKAKKMAEQAQAKLDEAQKNFNQNQQGGEQSGGPAVEYDAHGRPVNSAADAPPAAQPSAPPPGDPLGDPAPTPDAATTGASPSGQDTHPHGDPLLSDEPGSRQGTEPEPERKPPAPGGAPGMTSGDPLG